MRRDDFWAIGWLVLGALGAMILGSVTRYWSAPVPASVSRPASVSFPGVTVQPPRDDGKLRIICFGAHPDDCELRAAGVAALWAAQGHHVKFVSLTNGDIGHWQMAGGPLALRRLREVQQCARILGIETQVIDIHDGELMPTLENRKLVTRLIREWGADIVMSHRPNDYHPDHRNVGLLVQDAAYMVIVPFFCPDTPPLKQNPVFLYYEDRFHKPNPFFPDVVVAIDRVIDKKLACVESLESQFYEGGCCSGMTQLPQTDTEKATRRRMIREQFEHRFAQTADRFREALSTWYGPDRAREIRYAEAFELCEYGRQPTREELRQLFPFFDGAR
jgi:LmbE family N-acetylglucosaminyl deacetylase